MSKIETIISDFGGVLTSPLLEAFLAYEKNSGISMKAIGEAIQRFERQQGYNLLFELEKGTISESNFIKKLDSTLTSVLSKTVSIENFRSIYFDNLKPNNSFIKFISGLKNQYRLALLTNNVREWDQTWRKMLPVEEIFELVVNSAFVGMRKPDLAIYKLTLEKLDTNAKRCLFIDDIKENCEAAYKLGFNVVHFKNTKQTIEEIDQILR